MMIGIYFPCGKPSRTKEVCGKIVTTVFTLFSLYYLILLSYHAYYKGYEEFLIGIIPQFLITTFMHQHMSRHANKIVENCKILLKKKTNLSALHEKTVRILIMTATAVSFSTFCVVGHFQHSGDINYSTKMNRKYHLFTHTSSQIYLIILAEFLSTLKNWIIFMVPGMTINLLAFIYYELGNLVYEMKTKVSNIMATAFSKDMLQIQQCADIINKTSLIVRQVDTVLNKPMFYILSLLMIKVMILTSVLTKDHENAYLVVLAVFLGCGVFVALLLIMCLASRIQENFTEMKDVILTSQTVQHKILSGNTEAISYVGLVQILNENSDKFYVTAMGFIKIEKTVILTMISAIVS